MIHTYNNKRARDILKKYEYRDVSSRKKKFLFVGEDYFFPVTITPQSSITILSVKELENWIQLRRV